MNQIDNEMGDLSPVIVTDKLLYYIDKYNWDSSMSNLIGKKILPFNFRKNYSWSLRFECDVYEYGNWLIPADCCIKTNKIKRITNLEIDPFDEEDWGYIQENVKHGDRIAIIL